MPSKTPYTYIQCPCSDPTTLSSASAPPFSPTLSRSKEDIDNTFDPRAPRSNFSLFPLEHLLYCEDCHQIRCPRCINEEIVTYFCPHCLFEVPSSNLKSEGNRCTRSCFQCPVCTSPLAVTATESIPGAAGSSLSQQQPGLGVSQGVAAASQTGQYTLVCSYCCWNSAEIGIKFDKPSGIYNQLWKLQNGGKPRLQGRLRKDKAGHIPSHPLSSTISPGSVGLGPPVSIVREDNSEEGEVGKEEGQENKKDGEEETLDTETQFAALKSFYQKQLSESTSSSSIHALAELGFSSPTSLSRIMSLYSGGGSGGLDKRGSGRGNQTAKHGGMREAHGAMEGVQIARLDESDAISRLRRSEWSELASEAQNAAAFSGGAGACPERFVADLRPAATLLRAKRSKRCPVCRHIIAKPEAKVTNTRFRIKLVAGSYIPHIVIRSMASLSLPPVPASAQPYRPPETLLKPLQPAQFLLTFHNPIFEPVKVTLATPAVTPGRFQSKVTVLCPEFEIDANTDVWDEALRDGGGNSGETGAASGAVTAVKDGRSAQYGDDGAPQYHQAEAGRIWERGRNWVTIVVEVVPASIRPEHLSTLGRSNKVMDTSPLREDEDVLEIPMFVRLVWEVDTGQDDVRHDTIMTGKGDKGGKDQRELTYWCAIGVGRIQQS